MIKAIKTSNLIFLVDFHYLKQYYIYLVMSYLKEF